MLIMEFYYYKYVLGGANNRDCYIAPKILCRSRSFFRFQKCVGTFQTGHKQIHTARFLSN